MSVVAPGGKISFADYERLLLEDACYRTRHADLSDRQIQRIVRGDSWAQGWKPPRVEPEFKRCKICGERYERRYANGRLRSPKFWAQKETCSHTCAVRLAWKRGVFENRGRA